MKKPFTRTLSFMMLLLVCSFVNSYGQQDLNLEYTITQNEEYPDNIDISVTVVNGTSDFIFRLYDGDYLEDGQLQSISDPKTTKQYVFKNQLRQAFMVCVSDSNETTVCKMVLESMIPEE